MSHQAPARRRANRLAGERSPYLLQHAHNPVDWRPWGAEAIAEARARGLPIFLSIGYSTCYWCHVMERESFEDEATARLMNEGFINIKIDREERPDIDDIYMAAVLTISGRGGWPMSVFLEPHALRPYWAGTYFPPRPGHGMPSFTQILEGMSRAWREQREQVLKQADAVADAVRERLAARSRPVPVGQPQVVRAASALLASLDRVRGGFGGAPKFPQPAYLDFLLDFLPFSGDDATRTAIDSALRLTLDRMALGGMHDQAGGGFHRYSVDAEWIVPHFEKMLYDNALLASLYARASQPLGDEFYGRIARRTLDYVLREMTSPEGAFFSAQDAEVDGREGLNYLWNADEVRAAVQPDDASMAVDVYGIGAGPNFRDPHHAAAPPSNVLRLEARPEAIAQTRGMSTAELVARLDRISAGLLSARTRRKQPRLDDKALAGWNGLMIGAMAAAGAALGEPRYVNAARRAADFVLSAMRDAGGDLLRSWRAGRATIPAVFEDYAFVVHGLIDLHRAIKNHSTDPASGTLTGTSPTAGAGTAYLDAALGLFGRAQKLFGDGAGGFFDTRADQADLFVRARSTYDGAVPSGVSVMLHNLIDLHQITHDRAHLDAAVAALASVSGSIAESPLATINSTRAVLRLLSTDAAVLESSLGRAAGDEPPADSFTPVEVFASAERLGVGADQPAELTLRFRIAPGYHVNAADPAPADPDLAESLVPLRVGVVNGSGIAVYADYPEGEPAGARNELRVHRGEFELRVAVDRAGDWTGRPLLSVTYQACTDTECLEPRTVELDVAIDRLD